MSSTTLPIETRLTPTESLLTDEIGNEVYASHYAERKLSRFVIGTETILLLGAFGLIFSLAHRPIANRYIRIDEMGRAQAIAYTDLNYSPREGEVRTYLTDWANYRYTLSRDTITSSRRWLEARLNRATWRSRTSRLPPCPKRQSRAQRLLAEPRLSPSTSSIPSGTRGSRGRSIGCSV